VQYGQQLSGAVRLWHNAEQRRRCARGMAKSITTSGVEMSRRQTGVNKNGEKKVQESVVICEARKRWLCGRRQPRCPEASCVALPAQRVASPHLRITTPRETPIQNRKCDSVRYSGIAAAQAKRLKIKKIGTVRGVRRHGHIQAQKENRGRVVQSLGDQHVCTLTTTCLSAAP